jgi:hypothetical protein
MSHGLYLSVDGAPDLLHQYLLLTTEKKFWGFVTAPTVLLRKIAISSRLGDC